MNRPEGEFRTLTNMPALLVGKPEGGHAGLSKRLEPPLWGQGIRLGSSPTNLSGLAQTTRPFMGPGCGPPASAKGCFSLPLGPAS